MGKLINKKLNHKSDNYEMEKAEKQKIEKQKIENQKNKNQKTEINKNRKIESNDMEGQNLSDKKTYSTWENIKYIISHSWKYDKSIFGLFCIFTILTGVFPFIGILFPKYILDELTGSQDKNRLILLLVSFFFSSAVIGYFVTFIKNSYLPKMIDIRFQFIHMLSIKCMTTDYKNTEEPSFLNSVETAFRALQSNTNGLEGILHKLFSLGGNIIVLIGYMLIIGKLNIFILLYLIANVSLVYYFTFSVKKYEYNQADELSDIDRHSKYSYDLMYNFAYGKDMRIYSLTDWIGNLFQKQRFDIEKKIKYKYFGVGVREVILLLIREGIVYAYLIYLVLNKGLSIGSFTMYFAAIASFASAMKVIMDDMAHIRAQSLYVSDFRVFMDRKEEKEPAHPRRLPEGPYEIEFKNVTFRYPGSEKYVYKDISFHIKPGQKLAIVGHNGAGKTTFVKLLCRMYEPESGEILLNGINIQEFSKRDYYTLFSAVFQEIKTLAFSVAENIAVSEGAIKEDKVLQCLDKADMKKKVLEQKNGIYTGMQKILDDEGVEFSGGETQRIILARALYKDAGIVILDEPTAALDAIAERSIYEKFNEMVEGKTSIFISHRLASTSFCDVIAMFEEGQLIEYGTHEELLAKNEKYAEMFQVQAQYYKEDEVAVTVDKVTGGQLQYD